MKCPKCNNVVSYLSTEDTRGNPGWICWECNTIFNYNPLTVRAEPTCSVCNKPQVRNPERLWVCNTDQCERKGKDI